MKIFAETGRLILRELHLEDEQGMFELDSDPLVHQFVGNKPVKTMDEVRYVIQFVRQQYLDNGIGRWAVVEKQSGNFIGWAGLKLMKEPINGREFHYDLGYRFIRKYWGKGYATESALVILKYGFVTMHLDEIYGRANVANIASRNVLEKVGMKWIGQREYDEILHDLFLIKKEEWMSKFQNSI